MICEKTIAQVFAVILLIGFFCVGYVLLTQPTGMITYQTTPEQVYPTKEKISQEEMTATFEQEWDIIKGQLIILGESEK